MNSAYEVRFFVPEDRESLEHLYRAIYGEAWREKTSLGWSLDRPLAEGGAAVAVQNGVVFSAQPYCDFPLHTPWGGARATLLLDVATHPAHQRRGLFRRVVAVASAAAFERGASIIMTTPNRLSFAGFQMMPEWMQLCSLDCMLLPLGAGNGVMEGGLLSLGARGALAAVSPLCKLSLGGRRPAGQLNCTIEAPWSPNADADELWDSVLDPARITVVRDRAFLQWRFGPHYQLFIARNSRGITGYAAARVISRAGLKIGIILDYLTNNDETCALPLLSSVISWLREQGATAAMGYFLEKTAPWRQFRTAGFLSLPRFCAPRDYPVCVNVRPGDSHYTDLSNPSSWHLSVADSDLV